MSETLTCKFCKKSSTFLDDNGSTLGFDCPKCGKFNEPGDD